MELKYVSMVYGSREWRLFSEISKVERRPSSTVTRMYGSRSTINGSWFRARPHRFVAGKPRHQLISVETVRVADACRSVLFHLLKKSGIENSIFQ